MTTCIACGAQDRGGYEIENGPGPFCADCWMYLKESLEVRYRERYIAFFYLLIRDEITPGRLYELLTRMPNAAAVFSSRGIESMAREFIQALEESRS